MNNIVKKYAAHHDKKADFHLEAARKGGIMAVYKLFNRYYIKSFFGPFFTFVFPVMLYGILGSIMNANLLFAGMIAMSALGTGISGMPFAILELKKSVLMKRIGASPVKPSVFTTVIITYYTLTIFISILWLMIWSLIFFQNPEIFKPLGTVVGFFGFLYGNILNIVVSLAVGFAISAVSKSEVQAQTFGMLIYFPSTFLSGQFVSIDSIANSEVMNWISRFIPFRYTTMLIVESWSGNQHLNFAGQTIDIVGNPFAIHEFSTIKMPEIDWTNVDQNKTLGEVAAESKWTTVIYDKADHICGYIVPYIMLVGAGVFSIKKFTWSAGR